MSAVWGGGRIKIALIFFNKMNLLEYLDKNNCSGIYIRCQNDFVKIQHYQQNEQAIQFSSQGMHSFYIVCAGEGGGVAQKGGWGGMWDVFPVLYSSFIRMDCPS